MICNDSEQNLTTFLETLDFHNKNMNKKIKSIIKTGEIYKSIEL